MKGYKKIKKLGSSRYYISNDKNYFLKHTKQKIAKKEYENLKSLEKVEIKDLNFIKPVNFLEKKGILITEYINTKSLVHITNPKIYFQFGRKLKEFHNKGFTHSHLQINDVLYQNNQFILTDLVSLNKKTPVEDLAIFKLSVEIFKIKKPWKIKQYNKCLLEFFKGYNLKDKNLLNQKFQEIIDIRINNFIKSSSLKSLFTVLLLKLIRKLN